MTETSASRQDGKAAKTASGKDAKAARDGKTAKDISGKDGAPGGAEGGSDRDPDAVLGFIERYATVLIEFGFPRMPARVFVALLATDSGRLTATQLADVLRVSPAAISGAMRFLIQLNLASREREPGSRRDVYRVHDDVWYAAAMRRDQMLVRWDSTLREGIEVLGADTPAGRRMAESLAYVDFIQEELPAMLARWLTLRDELRARWAEESESS